MRADVELAFEKMFGLQQRGFDLAADVGPARDDVGVYKVAALVGNTVSVSSGVGDVAFAEGAGSVCGMDEQVVVALRFFEPWAEREGRMIVIL